MDAIMVKLQTALSMGEDIVDRNPTACLTPYMVRMEKNFGGSRASWFLGLFTCVTFLLYLIGGLALITNLVGFLYPAFASFKAIDSPDALASQQWLSYWAVFGAFFTSETAFAFVVSLVPYYNVWKMIVLVYCFHPYTKGATQLYDSFLRPLIIQHVLPGTGAAKRRAAASPSPAGVAAAAASAAPGFSVPQAGLTRGVPAVTVPAVADLIAPELNELRVVVVSASDVVPTEAPGQGVDCDPYCVLEVLPEGFRQKQGAAEKTKYKTACKTGTANPVWNERVTIPQVEHLDAKLVVTVCNKRAMGRDQCLGKIEVPLSEAKVKGAVEPADMLMALTQTDDSTSPPCGELRVTVQLK